MIPHFSPEVRKVLLQMPPYTPALLAAGDELTLVLQVEKLAPLN
jgi:hypothetical protein